METIRKEGIGYLDCFLEARMKKQKKREEREKRDLAQAKASGQKIKVINTIRSSPGSSSLIDLDEKEAVIDSGSASFVDGSPSRASM